MVLTNLRELNEQDPAPFSDTILVCLDDYIEEKGLLFKGVSHQKGHVPLERIVGHCQGYRAFSWGEGLMTKFPCDRMESRLKDVAEDPEFYKYSHTNQRENMSFIKVGDDYFISTGKHRTVIARFLEHYNPLYLGDHRSISDVSIEWKTIDYDFMHKRDEIYEIQEQYPDLTFDVTHTTDDDGHALMIHPHSSANGESFSRAELRDVIDAFKNPNLIKKLSNDKIHRLIPLSKCLLNIIG